MGTQKHFAKVSNEEKEQMNGSIAKALQTRCTVGVA